jgi:hypothetical protein
MFAVRRKLQPRLALSNGTYRSRLAHHLFVSLTATIFHRLAFAVTFGLSLLHVVRDRGGVSTRSDPKLNMSEGV